MSNETQSIAPLPSEIAALADQVLGSSTLAQRWLQRPALALDGQLPVDLMASEQGRQSLLDLLLCIEFGVYT